MSPATSGSPAQPNYSPNTSTVKGYNPMTAAYGMGSPNTSSVNNAQPTNAHPGFGLNTAQSKPPAPTQNVYKPGQFTTYANNLANQTNASYHPTAPTVVNPLTTTPLTQMQKNLAIYTSGDPQAISNLWAQMVADPTNPKWFA